MKEKKYSEIIQHFFSNKLNKILTIIFLLILVIFFSILKQAAVIFFLIFLCWITKFYQRYLTVPFGIDFTLMSTVLTTYVYGTAIGIFTGITSMFLVTLWSGKFSAVTFFGAFLLILFSFVIPIFNEVNITILGIILTFIYNAIQVFAYVNIFGGRIHRSVTFVLSSIPFNIWAFIMIAPKILVIM